MSQKSLSRTAPPDAATVRPLVGRTVRDIRRATREPLSAEGEMRIVLEGRRGKDSIAALCRREGIAEACEWIEEPLEAGKRRLLDDTRAQSTGSDQTIFPLTHHPRAVHRNGSARRCRCIG